MSLPLAVVAGVLPMLIYPVFLYLMDRFEKEPLVLVGASFLWGFVPAALLSLLTQFIVGVPFLLLDSTGALADTVLAVAVAPFTEEISKALALLLIFLIWHDELDGIFDGIIYGSLVGFGFAAIENILYFLDAGGSVVFSRSVLFGLNHALYTSLTGIGFGIARHAQQRFLRFGAPLAGLVIAMAMHSFHNVTLLLSAGAPGLVWLAVLGNGMGIAFVFGLMLVALGRERRRLVDELREEVVLRTLSEAQYQVACSPRRRWQVRIGALVGEGPQAYREIGYYFRALTELAFRKHAYRRRGEAGASVETIHALRVEVMRYSARHADLH